MNIVKGGIGSDGEYFWSVPTSGYGDVEDEQPLPYIVREGDELAPRFGGESAWQGRGVDTLPLPYGTLKGGWPLLQRAFNLPRRRINIYWRNMFVSRCRKDRLFSFAEQLSFFGLRRGQELFGFWGVCPLVSFERTFEVEQSSIRVRDQIQFRRSLAFERFYPLLIPHFEGVALEVKILKGEPTEKIPITSSTGSALLWREKMTDIQFRSGDLIERSFTYRLP